MPISHLPPFPGLAWRDDSLYSKQPCVEELTAKRFSFLLVAKPGDHKSLYEDVDGLRRHNLLDRHHTEHRGVRHEYEWVTGLPLNGKPDAPLINFILFRIVEVGKATHTNVWVTDLVPTIDNIAQLVRAARARWKIENEMFNTIFQLVDGLYQRVRTFFSSRRAFWDEVRSAFRLFLFTSWDQILERMNSPPQPLPRYRAR